MIKDVCAEGKVPELSHVLRAGEPILRWLFETYFPYLKLLTYGPLFMHIIITRCIGVGTYAVKKVYNILLSITAVNHKKDTLSAHIQLLSQPQILPWITRKKENLNLKLLHSGLLPFVEVCSTFNKSMLFLLLLCILSNSLFNSPRTWDIHNLEVSNPLDNITSGD
jgi:hypothetical protein